MLANDCLAMNESQIAQKRDILSIWPKTHSRKNMNGTSELVRRMEISRNPGLS